ncbi:hypothetical protein JCM8547_004889 [Rhodosporidiobolus lusitaniae]
MFSTSRTLLAGTALLAWAATAVDALAITTPSVATIWDTTGTNPNYVIWQLYPLTNPAPSTPYFDIYIRNGVAAMYDPPLNTTLATAVDSTTMTYYQVLDVQKFSPGPGYQLFLSDPTNPDTVYADSDVFSIGTPDVGAAPITPSASSESLPSLSSSSASTAVTETTATTTAVVLTTASTTNDGRIPAATVPGGPAEQGYGLITDGAAGLKASVMGAVVAVGAAVVMLAA